MGVIRSFVSRREEQLLEGAINPFDKNLIINQRLLPSQISAINFIAMYQGIRASTYEQMFSLFFKRVQETTTALLYKDSFRPQRIYSWQGFNQSEDHLVRMRLRVENPLMYNLICNRYPNQDLGAKEITMVAINQFIQSFVDYFNGRPSALTFRPKKVAFRQALKEGNANISTIIREHNTRGDYITFGDVDELIDSKIIFYRRNTKKN